MEKAPVERTGNGVVRVGIIGLGQLAREVHVPVLSRIPAVRVAGLADVSADALKMASPLAPEAEHYSSLEEMLAADRVDAVIVASPTGEHARHAQLVLAANKALYLEKPLAASLEEGAEVLSCANQRRALNAMMGFNYRFHPLIEHAKRKLARIGARRVTQGRSTFSFAPRPLPPWKQSRQTGGGVLLDLASHHFFLLRYVLGSEVASVRARVWSERTEGDCATAELKFANGVPVECSYSFCRTEQDEIEFSTRAGAVRVHRYAPLDFPWWPPQEFVAYQRERMQSPWKEVSFARSLGAWVNSIQTHQPPPLNLQDGLQTLRVVVAAEQSAQTGETVTVNHE